MTDQDSHSSVNPDARSVLRRQCLATRMALTADAHAAASRSILAHLETFLMPRSPGIIAFCAPIRAEVDCQPLIEKLLAAGWQAAMPAVIAPASPMLFRPWSPATAMTADPHGIPIPDTTVAVIPSVVLLPVLAFDRAGYRLGYGGGYFDRTLVALHPRPLSVGVGFHQSSVDTLSPTPHDVPLDVAVTEQGLHYWNACRHDSP
jgi:5,10-methenyltetrahydrofolate synthetase